MQGFFKQILNLLFKYIYIIFNLIKSCFHKFLLHSQMIFNYLFIYIKIDFPIKYFYFEITFVMFILLPFAFYIFSAS